MNALAYSLRDDRHASAPADVPSLVPGAHKYLADSMRHALLTDPSALVGCPGFAPPYQPAADLVYDAFAGKDGDELLHDALRIIGVAAKTDPRASAWIARFSKKHADFHAGDMARLLQEAA